MEGAPVFMVMAEPSSSLVVEPHRLVPTLQEMIGDRRRVLIGFDREGWSPQLFHELSRAGFDPLTWRKGEIENLKENQFSQQAFTDEWGVTHSYGKVADTLVELDHGPKKNPTVFGMRQVSRIVDAGKQVREATDQQERQIHLLTTNTELPAAELLPRISSRWRHENYFHYAREHFALDAHDSYQAVADDGERSVPNPAKAKAKAKRDMLAPKLNALLRVAEAQELELASPALGGPVVITNAMLNDLRAPVATAQKELAAANAAYRKLPTRLPPGGVNPGQLVLETEVKQLLHGFRMAAYNIMMMLVSAVRTNTGYSAAKTKAHDLVRQVLKQSGDVDPRHDGHLDIGLDPMPTGRETRALGELCQLLTATETRYPGTDRVLRYRVKP